MEEEQRDHVSTSSEDSDASQPVYSARQIDAILRAQKDQILAELAGTESATVTALREQVHAMQFSARGQVVSPVPEHAGGIGLIISETWSQFEQMRAREAAEKKLQG
jgi:hypothetical protein